MSDTDAFREILEGPFNYMPDLTDFDSSDVADDGQIGTDIEIWQGEIVDTNDLSLLEVLIDPIIIADDVDEMSQFMYIRLEPMITEFARILPTIYSYIWELTINANAERIAMMLIKSSFIVGFSGEESYLDTYYNSFWSKNTTDNMMEILLQVFPANNFIFYCIGYLASLDPHNVNIERLFEYIEYFNDPSVYIGNNFRSIYDIACFLRPAYPDIFIRLEEHGIPYNNHAVSSQYIHYLSEVTDDPPSKFDITIRTLL